MKPNAKRRASSQALHTREKRSSNSDRSPLSPTSNPVDAAEADVDAGAPAGGGGPDHPSFAPYYEIRLSLIARGSTPPKLDKLHATLSAPLRSAGLVLTRFQLSISPTPPTSPPTSQSASTAASTSAAADPTPAPTSSHKASGDLHICAHPTLPITVRTSTPGSSTRASPIARPLVESLNQVSRPRIGQLPAVVVSATASTAPSTSASATAKVATSGTARNSADPASSVITDLGVDSETANITDSTNEPFNGNSGF
jgi:hypothetical protein